MGKKEVCELRHYDPMGYSARIHVTRVVRWRDCRSVLWTKQIKEKRTSMHHVSLIASFMIIGVISAEVNCKSATRNLQRHGHSWILSEVHKKWKTCYGFALTASGSDHQLLLVDVCSQCDFQCRMFWGGFWIPKESETPSSLPRSRPTTTPVHYLEAVLACLGFIGTW